MKGKFYIWSWLLPSYKKSDDDTHMLCIMFLLYHHLHMFLAVQL